MKFPKLKLSPPEKAALLLCAALAVFFAGWFARGLLVRGTYTVSGAHPAAAPAVSREDKFLPDVLVDLNAATLADLAGLPGVGEVRAQAILDYRAAHGPFSSLEELAQVEGIGPKTLDALRDYLTVTISP